MEFWKLSNTCSYLPAPQVSLKLLKSPLLAVCKLFDLGDPFLGLFASVENASHLRLVFTSDAVGVKVVSGVDLVKIKNRSRKRLES